MSEHSIYLDDIPLDEARERLATALRLAGRWDALPGEIIPLDQALGRITAEPIWAKLSSPHYHASAMDGYAVLASDTNGASETRPITLKLDEQAFAVNTGDPLPANTNAVIMVENIHQAAPDTIMIHAAAAPWHHVRMIGEDMIATELVLPTNHRIRPVDLGAIAGSGSHTVVVRRKPRVTIIPTGSELVPIVQTPGPGQIIEYNSLMLSAQVAESGGVPTITDIIPDSHDHLLRALQAAVSEEPDLILMLSGSSAGSKDFTAAIIRSMGTVLVHGVAVRPGHPVILGMIANIPVIGVPGYPVSAALTGELFVQPLLAQWLGIPAAQETRPRVQAAMTYKLVSPTGDDDFVRVSVAQVGERLLATPLHRGAGVITSLARADGLAHIPRFSEGADVGQQVEVLLYRTLEEIQNTVMVMGSHDPMIDLLGQYLSLQFPRFRITSAHVGSMGGLVGLRRGVAHLAGSHLLDTQTGDYNIAYVQQYLPDTPTQIITFAHREQGLYVTAGNPHHIHSFEDLTRVRYVNRQRGAGTRVLLDYELEKRGISPYQITGYTREEYTHLAVAAAVASGVADCGMGVRSGAVAMNLDFIPVGWERYDLVIPAAHLDHPGIIHLLEVLKSPAFQQALMQQPGYDTRESGKRQH